MSKIYVIGLEKTCLGVLDRSDREKDNETGLKEKGGIEMSTTVAFPYTRLQALPFAFQILTVSSY